jgi:uncharacterized protein
VLEAWGEPREVAQAYTQATAAFTGLLAALVAELPLLRRPVADARPTPEGPVARRMVDAVWPHRAVFITPMAAVAGAVADHLLAALTLGRQLERAYVNNGGDIALHLAPGTRLDLGFITRPDIPQLDGRIVIHANDAVRGVATSGWRGRSFSLGIADAVTVLACDAATADAAATVIANAANVEHPAIQREPACSLSPDSDLGDLLVTTAVGTLPPELIEAALAAGAEETEALRQHGLVIAAALWLQGRLRVTPQPAELREATLLSSWQ